MNSVRRPRALIVNDDASLIFSLEVMFSLAGFDTVSARNGFEAHNIVNEVFKNQVQHISTLVDEESFNRKHKAFDIIMMDLNMPIQDGYDACKSITQLY